MTESAPAGYKAISRAVAARGLVARGGLHLDDSDGVPPLAGARPAIGLVLVGMTAEAGWAAFESAPECDGGRDSLDRFSRRVLQGCAHELGAEALFPFSGPPWWPFQAWALRAEPVAPSPLGLLIHARHGLWHGYRGALIFAHRIDHLPQPAAWRSPCLDCAGQPCLHTCPVQAFGADGFSRDACGGHLAVDAQPCLDAGCLARAACPVAPAARYSRPHRRFHMQAFRRNLFHSHDDG